MSRGNHAQCVRLNCFGFDVFLCYLASREMHVGTFHCYPLPTSCE